MARLDLVEARAVVAVDALRRAALGPRQLRAQLARQAARFQRLGSGQQRDPDSPIDNRLRRLVDQTLGRLTADAGVEGVRRVRINMPRKQARSIRVRPRHEVHDLNGIDFLEQAAHAHIGLSPASDTRHHLEWLDRVVEGRRVVRQLSDADDDGVVVIRHVFPLTRVAGRRA